MYCVKCGRKLDENVNFCDKCGTPVLKTEKPRDERQITSEKINLCEELECSRNDHDLDTESKNIPHLEIHEEVVENKRDFTEENQEDKYSYDTFSKEEFHHTYAQNTSVGDFSQHKASDGNLVNMMAVVGMAVMGFCTVRHFFQVIGQLFMTLGGII